MAGTKDDVISLPLEMVETSGGFAVDIGGSMAKIVYRSKKDYKNGKTLDPHERETGLGKVHGTQFPRGDTDTYVKFLRENCDITSGGQVFGTGTGGSQFKTALESLGVTMTNVSEFDCFSISINTLLDHFAEEEWLHPTNRRGLDEGVKFLKFVKTFQDMTAGRKSLTPTEFDDKYLPQVERYLKRVEEQRSHLVGAPYPYLMVLCGSAFGLIKVEADGSMEMLEINMMSGRLFLGMSTLLTGEKDYDKIIEACTNFDGSTVDIMGRDQLSEHAEKQEDSYSRMDPNARIFPFGKGHYMPRDQIENGDMLSSLNQCLCDNLAMSVFNCARANGLTDAYFCGGFVSQEIMRRYITKALTWRNLSIPSGTRVHVEFIANSGTLGSIGAFMFGKKPTKSHKQSAK